MDNGGRPSERGAPRRRVAREGGKGGGAAPECWHLGNLRICCRGGCLCDPKPTVEPAYSLQAPSGRPSGHARTISRCKCVVARLVRMAFSPIGASFLPAAADLFQVLDARGLLGNAPPRLREVALGQNDDVLKLIHGAPGWPQPWTGRSKPAASSRVQRPVSVRAARLGSGRQHRKANTPPCVAGAARVRRPAVARSVLAMLKGDPDVQGVANPLALALSGCLLPASRRRKPE
jgi:hypothetical protein